MARFNQNVYNHIIAVGGSAASANNAARARRPGRALQRFLAAFTPPQQAAPTPQYTPPPMPKVDTYKAPQLANATTGSVGKGVGESKQAVPKKTLASLLMRRGRRTKVASQYGGNFGTGTGLNVPGRSTK